MITLLMPSAKNRGLFLIIFFGLSLLLWTLKDFIQNMLWLLNSVNLAFHEGGHIVFGLLGNHFLLVLGGTLMQLLLPLAAWFQFQGQNQPAAADVCLFWFGENFIGIGRYMADARAQQLPLIGSGEHDWTYLLESTGLLIHDVGLGQTSQVLGCLVMGWALTLIIFRFWESAP